MVPLGYYNGGVPKKKPLHTQSAMIRALKYLTTKGGTMILHGYTHQYSIIANPYTAVSEDDCEFYRITQNADHTLNYVGPVAEDSTPWAQGRFNSAAAEVTLAGLN